MITMIIINLQDAKAKLSPGKYEEIKTLFDEFQQCKTMFEVDYKGYIDLCEDVIKRFDKIAPYELYSGGNELEFSIYMDYFREREKTKEILMENHREEIVSDFVKENGINKEYVKSLMNCVPDMLYEDAEAFYKILVEHDLFGKKAALSRFDKFVEKVKKEDGFRAAIIVPYLCGALVPNGIITSEESDAISKKYTEGILGEIIPNNVE